MARTQCAPPSLHHEAGPAVCAPSDCFVISETRPGRPRAVSTSRRALPNAHCAELSARTRPGLCRGLFRQCGSVPGPPGVHDIWMKPFCSPWIHTGPQREVTMKSAALPAHFRSMAPRLSLSPDARGDESIELSNLGSAAPGQQAPRSSRAGSHAATIPALLARECKQLHATFVAGARDIGKWFGTLRRKVEQLPAPAKIRAASMETLKALRSQAAMRCNAALEPARAMLANARALFAGEARPRCAQAGKMRTRCDSQASAHRFATLREVLHNDQRKFPPADKFVRRINQLCNAGKLAGQLRELNLAELQLLWSHLSRDGRALLAPGAKKMLCARGNTLLRIGFEADARAFQFERLQGTRQLPGWAARAPAEWEPKAALHRVYGMQAVQPGIRSAAARP